jgi:hypothetical protein
VAAYFNTARAFGKRYWPPVVGRETPALIPAPQKKENYPPTHIMSYDGTGITVVEHAENFLCDRRAIR